MAHFLFDALQRQLVDLANDDHGGGYTAMMDVINDKES